MKKISLLSLLTFFCAFTYAQDTIIKINGDQIFAKILEVSTTEVKYKKFDFQDGPDFIESKSNIQLIRYAISSKDKFDFQSENTSKPGESNTDYYTGPVNSNNKIKIYGNSFWYKGSWVKELDIQKVLLSNNDPKINLLVGNATKDRSLQRIGYIGIPLVVTAYILSSISGNSQGAKSLAYAKAGVICGVVALPFPIAASFLKHRHYASNKEAIKIYNAKF